MRFGTKCYDYNFKSQEDKLEKRAIPGVITGIDEDGLSYRVFNPETKKSCRISDVVIQKPPPLHEDPNSSPLESREKAGNETQPTEKSELKWADLNGGEEKEPPPPEDPKKQEDEELLEWSGERNVDADLGLPSVGQQLDEASSAAAPSAAAEP